MGKSYLDNNEIALCNEWLKHVFFPSIKNTFEPGYIASKSRLPRADIQEACKNIYKFIVERVWDTEESVTGSLNALTYPNAYFRHNLDDGDAAVNIYGFTLDEICRFVANLCAKTETFWDDGEHSAEEFRYFLRTPIGKALYDFRCFVSQDPATEPTTSTQSNPQAATQTTSQSATSTQSTTNTTSVYSTPKSGSLLNKGNARGLMSQTKTKFTVRDMYWIDGAFTKSGGKTKPRLHVKPLNAKTPLTVHFNSGQGFDDCILFWPSEQEARAFLAKADINKPNTVTNLGIKRQKTDPNGYFEVETVFGRAYIKASKLHEMLEALEKEEAANIEECKNNALAKFKEAYEAFQKFIKG